MAERAVGTFKSMIAKRVTGLDLDKERWIDLLTSVLHQYNRQVQSTTGFTPKDAQLAENRLKLLHNIKQKAKFARRRYRSDLYQENFVFQRSRSSIF